MTVGERMKMRRKELSIGVEKIAAHLKVSPATVYRYENGGIEKLPSDALKQIAEVLQTTPGWLMGWEEYDQASGTYRPKGSNEENVSYVPVKFAETKVLCQGFEEMPPETRAMIMGMFSAAYAQFKQQQGKDDDDDTAET